MSDPSLCRSLLRVYLLGGGISTSLEEAGKAVSPALLRAVFFASGIFRRCVGLCCLVSVRVCTGIVVSGYGSYVTLHVSSTLSEAFFSPFV